MATAVQIQNCKTIMHEEALYQFDEIDELIELVMSKITTYMSVDELFKDPEIVAFCQSKNLSTDFVVNVNIPPGITSFEEAFRYGFRRSLPFEIRSKKAFLDALIQKRIVAFC